MCNPSFTESSHVTAEFVYINGSDGRVPPVAGLILSVHPANERCRYKAMPSLIGWVQT